MKLLLSTGVAVICTFNAFRFDAFPENVKFWFNGRLLVGGDNQVACSIAHCADDQFC